MENYPSFNQLIQQSIIDHWDLDALTDYKGATLQYHDVARKIEKLHILFENCGVERGDKIALCGRNSSQWAVAFLATLTYGAVAVPILHEFMADQIHNIVNHSDAKLLFVGDHVATQIDPMQMPHLEGIINNPDYSLMVSRTDKLTYAREHLNELYGKKFPKYFRKEHVHYYIEENGDELALINYTSGTTGFSKGVMIPYRAIWSNYDFAEHVLGKIIKPADRIISILPMAHMYGMAFEFIFEFLHGCHVYYLNRVPSPAIIAQAFADIKPKIIIAVPLVIEKIIRKKVFPKIQNNRMRLLLAMPVVNKKVLYNGAPEIDSNNQLVVLNGQTTMDGINDPGSYRNPFNAEAAAAYIEGGGKDNVFVKGVVSELVNGGFGAQYGNGSFFISDDGTKYGEPTKDFEAYQVNYLGNQKWVEGDDQIAVGDKVVIYGPLTKYKTTYETQGKGAAYIFSLNGKVK